MDKPLPDADANEIDRAAFDGERDVDFALADQAARDERVDLIEADQRALRSGKRDRL